MTQVQKLMNQYIAAEQDQSIDLDSIPAKNRPAMEMRKRQASVEMATLKEQYIKTVISNAFTIFLEGAPEDVEAWAKIAAEEANTINVRADALYQRIADDIEPTIGDRRTFGTTQLGMLVGALAQIGKDLDAKNIPIPQIFDIHHTRTREELVEVIRSLTRAVVKDDLNKKWIEREVTKNALEIRYIRSVVPVVVIGATPVEMTSLPRVLFSGTTFVVNVTKENNAPEKVFETLGEIQKALKSMKNN